MINRFCCLQGFLLSARHPARDFLAHAIKDRVAAGGRSPLRLALRKPCFAINSQEWECSGPRKVDRKAD